MGQVRLGVDRSGFERFCAFIQVQSSSESVTIGVEATGHHYLTLFEFLEERGYHVVLLNPYQVLQFRRSQGKRARTNRLDARSIPQFVALSAPTATTVPTNLSLAGLLELSSFPSRGYSRSKSAPQPTHAAVDLAGPELLQVLPDLGGRTAQALLSTYGCRRPKAENHHLRHP